MPFHFMVNGNWLIDEHDKYIWRTNQFECMKDREIDGDNLTVFFLLRYSTQQLNTWITRMNSFFLFDISIATWMNGAIWKTKISLNMCSKHFFFLDWHKQLCFVSFKLQDFIVFFFIRCWLKLMNALLCFLIHTKYKSANKNNNWMCNRYVWMVMCLNKQNFDVG